MTGCEAAARLRQEATQAEWRDRLHVELDGNGNVTRSLDQHVIVALNDAGRDWRQVATVKLPGYQRPVSYHEVWRGNGPDPALPSLPRTVDLPQRVHQLIHEWVDQEQAAGRLVIASQLPPPAARRQLRESAGLSRPQVAELVGVSAEAIRLWETGERTPEGSNRDRYLDLLSQWSSGPPEPTVEAVEAAEDAENEDRPSSVYDSPYCAIHHPHRHVTMADHEAVMRTAVAQHHEKMQHAYGRST